MSTKINDKGGAEVCVSLSGSMLQRVLALHESEIAKIEKLPAMKDEPWTVEDTVLWALGEGLNALEGDKK